MVRKVFRPEWRTQNRGKRWFYARYMKWLERVGYVVCLLLLAAFAYSFVWQSDDWITQDGAVLEAVRTPVEADGPTWVERYLVQDGEEVQAGQPIAEVYRGPAAAAREAAFLARTAFAGRPETLAAPVAGVADVGDPARRVEEGGEVAVLRDYSRLVAKVSLAGKSVPEARVGQPARVTHLNLAGPAATLVRGKQDGAGILSRRSVDSSFRDEVERALAGRSVRARDDVPLTIKGVESIEVEAEVSGVQPDPAPEFALNGRVAKGEHVLSAQVGELPAELASSIRSALGRQLQVQGEPRFVVKLRAGGEGPADGKAISAASLKRSFDAEIEIVDVPAELLQSIRQAHLQGAQVTAKVSVRTGSRALASLLLRRS